MLPILFEGSVRAVVELASFSHFSPTHQAFLDQLTESIGLVLNTIEANTITENLLKQSQSQAQELQSRQEELASSNEDLAQPGAPSRRAEHRGRAQESGSGARQATRRGEGRAARCLLEVQVGVLLQHVTRATHPTHSLLILAGELEDNPEGNLTEGQVQFASVIHSSGTDLLRLLNDILDLAKVESGTVRLELSQLPLVELASRAGA